MKKWDNQKVAKVADKIAAEEDEALMNVDQAVDAIIAAFYVLDDNLPHVKTTNVPQKAAVDNVKELLDTGVKPYMADIAQALTIFDAEE